jgi:hypothetical protein
MEMRRHLGVICASIFFLLHGCDYIITGKMIKEVRMLPYPEPAKPTNIDNIVKKYIPIGISRKEAKDILVAEGFNIFEQNKAIDNCADCDTFRVIASYEHIPLFMYVYDYAIVVHVGFRNGRVAILQGLYFRGVFL